MSYSRGKRGRRRSHRSRPRPRDVYFFSISLFLSTSSIRVRVRPAEITSAMRGGRIFFSECPRNIPILGEYFQNILALKCKFCSPRVSLKYPRNISRGSPEDTLVSLGRCHRRVLRLDFSAYPRNILGTFVAERLEIMSSLETPSARITDRVIYARITCMCEFCMCVWRVFVFVCIYIFLFIYIFWW